MHILIKITPSFLLEASALPSNGIVFGFLRYSGPNTISSVMSEFNSRWTSRLLCP